MAGKTDVLIPALKDVRDAHAAVVDRFWTGVALTPPGTERQRLESQASEAQYHLGRIEARMREMRPPRGPLSAAGQLTWMVTRGVVRAGVLPLQAGVSAMRERVRGVGQASESRLLRAAVDEYTSVARALATCRAGKDIAERLNDQESAELLAVLGRQDVVLLESGEENLVRRARAAAAAAEGLHLPPGGAAEGSSLRAITRQVRAATTGLRALPRRVTERMKDPAGGAWREMSAATRVAEKVQGAMAREEALPVPGFGRLGVAQIQPCLRGLSQTELTVIEGYERAHAGRPRVLNAIEDLRQAEPWAGYDAMDPERIKLHLDDVSDDVIRKVLEYERRHRRRAVVISAAEAALQPAPEATHRTEADALGAVTHDEER
ncbi:hypothetical protein ACIHCX_32085 [Streptomyces sp. NPDC052043]|uniref:hypothetical protein n=1 Tax=Streptomyces sp. NPDC052043 TaxID=3365684 RepID=UPI0037D6ECA3